MNIRIIVNPSAGAGSAARKMAQLETELKTRGIRYQLRPTEQPRHATALAQQAIREGVGHLAVMGGDGTFSEVAQAWLGEQGSPVDGPKLSLIPAGTGSDLGRTLGFDDSLTLAIERMTGNSERRVDLGLVRYLDAAGTQQQRVFLNTTSAGISGCVTELANRGPKWLGGKTIYMGASLIAGLSYRNRKVRVRVDDEVLYEGPALSVIAANGRYFGGGMAIAPDAAPDDGRLHCVVLGDFGRVEAYGLTAHLRRGSHVNLSKVVVGQGRTVAVEALDPARTTLEADGETPGTLPITATLAPGALRVAT